MMSYINETDFVIENKELVYPEIITDGLQLYYDAKGKRDTDYHRDTMLDMSGNKNHGKLQNFAYEKHSGYKDGLVFDYIDDKLVRPKLNLKPDDFTFMLNGNIISFSSDGTVKRVQDGEVIESKGFNWVRNGNFMDGTSGWISGNGTFEMSIGKALTKGTSDQSYQYLTQSRVFNSSHAVYLRAKVKSLNDGTNSFFQMHDGIGNRLFDARHSLTKNEEFHLSGLYKPREGHSQNNIYVQIYQMREDGGPIEGYKFEVSNVMAIDLTETFGAGNEPTKEQMDKIVNRFGFIPRAQDLIDNIEYKGNELGDMENIIDGLYKTELLSGEEIYTDNSDDAVVHVEVDGKSYQHAGSGKNLFDIRHHSFNPTVTPNELGGFDRSGGPGGFAASEIKVKPNQTYTFSYKVEYGSARQQIHDGDGSSLYILGTGREVSFTPKHSTISIGMGNSTASNNVDSRITEIQLEKGSTATEYEPPAPTPDYPIEINHMAKNLLALSEEVISGRYVSEINGTFGTSSPHDLFKFFPVNPNIEYIIKGTNGYKIRQARVAFYDKNRVFISGQLFSADSAQNAKIISPSNAVFGSYSSGDTGTPYKYQYLGSTGTDIDVVSSVGRENLIPSRALRPSQATTTKEFTLSSWAQELISVQDTAKILEVGETYTLSYEAELVEKTTAPTVFGLQAGFLLYSQTGSIQAFYSGVREIGDNNKVSVTFVCPPLDSNHKFLVYTNRYTTNGSSPVGFDTVKFKNLKLEKGSTETPYSPAPEDITEDTDHPLIDKINILLDEPLRSVGDAKDRLFRDSDGLWKVERNVGKRILDGGEPWGQVGQSFRLVETAMADMGAGAGRNLRSSHFPSINHSGWDDPNSLGLHTQSTGTFIFFSYRGMSLSDFKDYLRQQNDSGTPVTLVFEIRTPTTETLDQELQDKLNNLRSFEESNYVYTVLSDKSNILSENLKPTLHAKFLYNNWYKEDRVINNLMIYNRALTNEEMLQNYKTIKRRWGM